MDRYRAITGWAEGYPKAATKGCDQDYFDLALFFEEALERGYAADLSLDSAR